MAWLLLLSTVPAALVGAIFEDQIDEGLGTPTIIAISLILGGLLLAVADRTSGKRKVENYGVRDSLIVGAAQALALNPGTSRSGITITAGRFIGFDRDAAARISFLMMIPVTTGAVLLKGAGSGQRWHPRRAGGPDARRDRHVRRIAGWIAVWGTLKLVRTHSFMPFVIFRLGTVSWSVLGYRFVVVRSEAENRFGTPAPPGASQQTVQAPQQHAAARRRSVRQRRQGTATIGPLLGQPDDHAVGGEHRPCAGDRDPVADRHP